MVAVTVGAAMEGAARAEVWTAEAATAEATVAVVKEASTAAEARGDE